jgi:hypothetical protein
LIFFLPLGFAAFLRRLVDLGLPAVGMILCMPCTERKLVLLLALFVPFWGLTVLIFDELDHGILLC